MPCGTPDKTGAHLDFAPLITTLCCLEHKNESIRRSFAPNAISKQFAFEKFMGWGIECLFKVQYKCVNLSAFIQDFSLIIYHRYQLFSWMHVGYLTRDCVFQGDPWCWSILCAQVTCREYMLMRQGDNCLLRPCHLSKFRDRCLPKTISLGFHQCPMTSETDVKTGPSSAASSFKILGCNSSGPIAFDGFKPFRSLVTPPVETAMSFIRGADLSSRGASLNLVWVNTSVNCTLNSSAWSDSDSIRPLSSLFSRMGFLGYLSSGYSHICRSFWGLPWCHQSSCWLRTCVAFYSPALKKVGPYWICHVLPSFRNSVTSHFVEYFLCLGSYFREAYTTHGPWRTGGVIEERGPRVHNSWSYVPY